jgi:hypothetical protein
MAAEQSVYPVTLKGELSIPPARGWWLLKWLLAIPHFIILCFLWIAYAVVTVIAFFAILFTAEYPRSLFDFNVGVLRWTWRVGFYSYCALGTDKYPPFSLDPDPAYPADLEVEYPGNLSRGLVLVKWWLLAIPHYAIISIFVGGWDCGWEAGKWAAGGEGAGLLFVLVLFAAIFLLFTGRYYQPFFRLVMGLNRWVYRVTAYASLMTDRYPPFRLWDD